MFSLSYPHNSEAIIPILEVGKLRPRRLYNFSVVAHAELKKKKKVMSGTGEMAQWVR